MAIDDGMIQAFIEGMLEQSEAGLAASRAEESERLDNLIHGIISRTQNPAFKARLEGLDREIHRVFTAAGAAALDAETAQTLELMQGIVVLSTVMDAIADARLAGAVPATDVASGTDLRAARLEDSDRLDSLIRGIISRTQNPAFKAWFEGLDREIHRVFAAAGTAAPDAETAQTLELMQGIVVLSTVMDAISEARLDAAGSMDQAAGLNPVISVSGDGSELTVIGAGFNPGERVIVNIAHTGTIQVFTGDGSLLEAQFSANETGAFSVTGSLPLEAGVYSLVATGQESGKAAVAPVVVQ